MQAAETFSDAESFFEGLRTEFKAGDVDFHGTYAVAVDPLVTPKERVQMVATEIWKISGHRFTVKDHRKLKSGHRTRFWCSQDEARKKKSKSKLAISCRTLRDNNDELNVTVQLKHAGKHINYTDVSMPHGALDMIHENVEWLTPVAMVSKVQATFPAVTAAQIHRAWMEMSEIFWRRDDLQLPSAAKLLEEHGDDVDIFKPEDIPEGVEMLCWGMKKVVGPLKGKIVEIGVDATSSSIDQGKHRKALTAWAKCLRDTYGVIAQFTHVDKDMAEIGMLKDVWNAKISLCWWHLWRAVCTRLAIAKLATTPYDPGRANAEFPFIDVTFVPKGQADGGEYEGGVHDSITPVVPTSQQPCTFTTANGLCITIPARQPLAAASKSNATETAAGDKSDTVGVRVDSTHARTTGAAAPKPTASKPTKATPKAAAADAASGDDDSEAEGTEKATRRTFCPAMYREPIVNMMEKHYCAHPLLPGYAPPSPEGIKRWAVMQMYKFCVEHALREVWAYLWENWYRSSRWELWARSVHPEIPVLKTTMILESHWRRIKHDFLHHFHMPRCDLLVWILIVKLAPTYYRKLDRLLTNTGRYRELPSWCKGFKRTWRKLEKMPITLPVNPAYKTDAKKMICTCLSMPTSRFLICKHTVQAMKPVPPVFFLEVKRRCVAPFWVHPLLRPLSDESDVSDAVMEQPSSDTWDVGPLDPALDSDDSDDDLVDTQIAGEDQPTFLEAMDGNIDLILEFAKGLKYQRQFRDQRMLQSLEREGASFLRLAKACLGKEKRLRSTRGEAPLTWERSTGSAMFYGARPTRSDEST
ncbi:hypothetical protein B0H10DRAFT_2369275 [Mycena sp. CBHHK59/15]|nr:hypothetical protein B0H10DRAFT_2369275 [Mycena sp. CBHHK59/15]